MSEETLFHEVLAQPPSERAAFLNVACAGQPELRAAVEALLAAHAASRNPLDRPAADVPEATGNYVPSDGDDVPSSLPPRPEVTGDYVPSDDDDLTRSRPSTAAQATTAAVRSNRFTIERVHAQGGLGRVSVARDLKLHRQVALKEIRPDRTGAEPRRRFLVEAELTGRLEHPGIVPVYALDENDDGEPYYVMRFIRGRTLGDAFRAYHKAPTALAYRDLLQRFVSVCQTVAYAHSQGVIHRDLKPANVMLGDYGETLVVDWGLAKVVGTETPAVDASTATSDRPMAGVDASAMTVPPGEAQTRQGDAMGTPAYMAPEQARGETSQIGPAADVFALGGLLYELLTQHRPFEGQNLTEVLDKAKVADFARPRQWRGDIPHALEAICQRAMAFRPEDRYATASALADDVTRWLADEPVTAYREPWSQRLQRWGRKHRALVTSAVAVLLIASIGATVATLVFGDLNRKLETANADLRISNTQLDAANVDLSHQKTQAEIARDKEAEQRRYAEAIANFVKDDFLALTSVEGQRQFGGDKLTKNATLRDLLDRAAKKLKERKDLDPRTDAELNWMIGISYRMAGDASLGIPYLERAAELRRQNLGASNAATLEVQNSLAVAYAKAGLMEKALPLLEDTFRLTKERLGPDAEETLRCGRNLASFYASAQQDDLALPLLDETLRRMRSKFGADHEYTLLALQTQATVHQHKGNTKEAIAVLDEALKLGKARYGTDHPNTYEIMNNLAVMYLETKQPSLAAPLLEEVLKIAKNRLEPDHPDITNITNNLVTTYRSMGKRDLELAMRKEMVDRLKVKLGSDHPDTITQLNNLGTAYLHAQMADQAVPLLEEGVKGATAKFGPNDFRTLAASDNLANAYAMTGKLAKAISLWEESLAQSKAKLGPDHIVTLRAMANLGDGYREAGKLDRAIAMLEEAVSRGKAKLGIDNFVTVSCMKSLASSYMGAGADAKLLQLLPDFLPGFRKMYAADRPQWSNRLAELGTYLVEHKHCAEAEPLARECLEIRENQLPDAWQTFNTKSLLGGALLGQKKYAEAEPFLLKGYEGMKQREKTIPPQGRPRLTEALERLVQLYEAMDKKDEAAKWRKELEAANDAQKPAEKQP